MCNTNLQRVDGPVNRPPQRKTVLVAFDIGKHKHAEAAVIKQNTYYVSWLTWLAHCLRSCSAEGTRTVSPSVHQSVSPVPRPAPLTRHPEWKKSLHLCSDGSRIVISPSETELREPPYPESTLLAATEEGVLDRDWWRGAYWDAMVSGR